MLTTVAMPMIGTSSIRGQIRLIAAADSARWRECLDRVVHDFYHSAEYHRFSEECGEGRAFLGVYQEGERRLLWPYLLRPIEDPGMGAQSDVGSVYGYPGPLGLGGAEDPAFLDRAASALCELWRSQQAVCAFTRLHPLLKNERFLPAAHPALLQGQTVSVDLAAGPGGIWKGYRKSLRHDLRKARALGLEVAERGTPGDVEQFARLYRETMDRNRAGSRHRFGGAYFRSLLEQLKPTAHLVMAYWKGRVVSGAIFVEWRGIAEYHFSATAGDFLPWSPAKLLLDEICRRGQAQGCHTLHLGGGRSGRGDGLFAFKAAFSPRRHAFRTWRRVLNRAAYRDLTAMSRRLANQNRVRLDESFFPLYRSTPLMRDAQECRC